MNNTSRILRWALLSSMILSATPSNAYTLRQFKNECRRQWSSAQTFVKNHKVETACIATGAVLLIGGVVILFRGNSKPTTLVANEAVKPSQTTETQTQPQTETANDKHEKKTDIQPTVITEMQNHPHFKKLQSQNEPTQDGPKAPPTLNSRPPTPKTKASTPTKITGGNPGAITHVTLSRPPIPNGRSRPTITTHSMFKNPNDTISPEN